MKKLKEPRLKKNLYIFGCSGIGKSICDTLGRLKTHYEAIIFVDPNYEKFDGEFYGYNVIPQNNLTKNNTVGSDVIFAFFKPKDIFDRNELINQVLAEYNLNLVSVIDTTAVISKNAKIGLGTYIAPNVLIDSDVIIGDNCIILFNTVISREVTVAGNSFISAGCVLKGSVSIIESSFISANVSLANTIHKNSFINAGIVVTEEVLESCIIGSEKVIKKIMLPDSKRSAQKRLRFLHP